MNQRKRVHTISIRLSDEELSTFRKLIEEAGEPTIQNYGLEALLKGKVTSKEEIEELTEINKWMAKLAASERQIGNNINQIARIANTKHNLSDEEFESIQTSLKTLQEEREESWQLIRSFLIRKQNKV